MKRVTKQSEHIPEYLVKSFERFRKQELREFRDYLGRPWRLFWTNFLVGTARGLGLLLGATIVLAVLGFILKEWLVNIPVVGEFFMAVDQWVTSTLDSAPGL